jgi:hypothetical protein
MLSIRLARIRHLHCLQDSFVLILERPIHSSRVLVHQAKRLVTIGVWLVGGVSVCSLRIGGHQVELLDGSLDV